ncbi:hypothetical protein [Actinokineospora enzanensis]|uniref:hypothetical protein n=1 Tax=Actinokineospora enzanensis TaxID=155975 RepID=UPI00038038C2|nr:hypothetical protein [Actinokineospora enzanensis]
MSFSQLAWERSAASVGARAIAEVPFYRGRYAVGLGLSPVPSAELTDRLWSLCPIAHPYSPAREPTLWTGDPADLSAVLRISGTGNTPVLEVRQSLVPWTRLGPRDYAPVLSASAVALDVSALDTRARELAAGRRTVLIAPPDEVADVVRRTARHGPVIHRLTTPSGDIPAVLHDPRVGYFAALAPTCGHWHIPWRRFHVEGGADGLLVTALRRRRPTLVRILVPARGSIGLCPRHRTPVIKA